MKTVISIFIVLVVFVGGYYFYEQTNEPVVCTLEAKICPDGTTVGRTGPNCEFAECPGLDTGSEDTLIIGDTTIAVEIADTPAKRTRGLSNRVVLPQDAGMLFIFDESDVHHFWMKDTLIPLDMIWIDENGQIVHIEENVTPDTYPKTFTSDEPALYVLEVNAGFIAENDIQKGDTVNFQL